METEDRTEATIKNINEGRALNLLFYRINNRFEGGIYLDNLEFEVIPSTEVIAGSGVYESRRFTFSKLGKMLEQFDASHLPLKVKDKSQLTANVLNSIQSLLSDEYEKPKPQNKDSEAAASVKSVHRLSFALTLADPAKDIKTRAKDMEKWLAK